MPRYELALIMQLLNRPQKIAALAETCTNLMKRGLNIRKVDSLGDRGLPHHISKNGETFVKGTYFILDVDAILDHLPEQRKYLKKDSNILQYKLLRHEKVYKDEPLCPGIVEVDYEAKLKQLDKSGKWKKIPTISNLNLQDEI